MSDHFDITLERKLETSRDETAPGVAGVRRIELITGAERRRRWCDDDKARIVVESFAPGANVSEVARRNGLSPQQLFAWRREARALFQDEGNGDAAVAATECAQVRALFSLVCFRLLAEKRLLSRFQGRMKTSGCSISGWRRIGCGRRHWAWVS